MGLFPLEAPVNVAVAAWKWGAYLGEDGLRTGIRAKVSSWRRIGASTIPASAKAGGQYLNSILAKIETHKAGYQEAILLNEAGYVADGSGENLFLVRDGVLITPPVPGLDPRGHHPREPSSPWPATRASRCSSARSPGASSTTPTRCSSPAPPPRSARSSRSTTTGLGPPGPGHAHPSGPLLRRHEGRHPRSAAWLDQVEAVTPAPAASTSAT